MDRGVKVLQVEVTQKAFNHLYCTPVWAVRDLLLLVTMVTKVTEEGGGEHLHPSVCDILISIANLL